MIKSFKCSETERIFQRERSRKFSPQIQRRAKMRLDRIEAAVEVGDLRSPPSHNLEKLSGNRKGQYSIRINDQWRICFRWRNGNAHDVEIVDYH